MTPQFIDLGLRDFREVQNIQEDLLARIKSGSNCDTILISQFNPVITLGRGAKESDILIDKAALENKKIPIYKIGRGGGATIHMPGQLVIYPLINLGNFKKDVGYFVRFLEDWIINLLAMCGIKGQRRGEFSGVWVEDRKICFIGIGISKWVSFHGLSLNIAPDLNYFSYINSCGIKKLKVTSVKEESPAPFDYEQLKSNLIAAFCSSLNLNFLV